MISKQIMPKLYNYIYTTEPTITMNIPILIDPCKDRIKKQKKIISNQKSQKYTSKIRRRYHNIKQPGFDVQRK